MTDIAGERAKLAAQGLKMRTREQWGAVYNYSAARPVDMPATRGFVHIAVVPATTMDPTVRLVERIGISRFPATGMSYNAAVWFDGTLLEGQPLTRRGAHTVNDFKRATCPTHGGSLSAPSWNLNVNSRAIVLPQSEADPVTDAQVDSIARWFAAQIRAGLMTRDVVIHGHQDVAAKACPGAKGYRRIPEIQQLVRHYAEHGLGAPPQEDDMPTADELWKHRVPNQEEPPRLYSAETYLRKAADDTPGNVVNFEITVDEETGEKAALWNVLRSTLDRTKALEAGQKKAAEQLDLIVKLLTDEQPAPPPFRG